MFILIFLAICTIVLGLFPNLILDFISPHSNMLLGKLENNI